MPETGKAKISAMGIFIIYVLGASLAIMGFRLIFPGESAPLAYFSTSWGFLQGLLEIIRLFPALALSALIIPFGFKVYAREIITPYSPKFLDSLKMSIISAIVAAVIYGMLSFLVFPMARNYETNLILQGRLYRQSRELAERSAAQEDWYDAAHYLAVCERIWPGNPELERLRIDTNIEIESIRIGYEPPPESIVDETTWPGQPSELTPVTAFEMAEIAMAEGRFFDAHWLATTGGRLAPPGSPERTQANQIAGRAWSGVNSTEPDILAPTMEQSEARNLFRIKLDAYNALIGGEWIRAYYSFLELRAMSPYDPDLPRLLALSEAGLRRSSFFIDEMEVSLGRVLNSAVFSLPHDAGRIVMRLFSLSILTDSAYGMEMELMAFDRNGQLLWSAEAPFVKIQPFTIGTSPMISVFMRALDRTDPTGLWEPEAVSFNQDHPFIDGVAEIILDVSWDNFVLISNASRGIPNLSPGELSAAAANLGTYGYPPEIFLTDLLQRFVRPMFLLPLGIIAISTGWRFRALKRPRYIAIPMLGILPVVVNGLEHISKAVINNIGIWAVITLGFNAAAIFFGIGIIVALILSLIYLASQHG